MSTALTLAIITRTGIMVRSVLIRIDDVITEFEKQGKKVCVVLRRHWLEADTDLLLTRNPRKRLKLPQINGTNAFKENTVERTTEEVKQEVGNLREVATKWDDGKNLLVSPPSLNDDWVLMYVCLTMTINAVRRKSDLPLLVSNDLMRDHFWLMRQNPGLLLWSEAHLMHYRITYPERHFDPESTIRELELFPPLPFSPRSQCSLDGSMWHFAVPSKSDSDRSDGDRERNPCANWKWIALVSKPE